MPLYHYKCENCNYEFEEKQSFKDKPLKKCSECKKLKLYRVIYPCHSHVKKSANDMGTVGDLAKYNTDKLTKWEKEAKDEKMGQESQAVKRILDRQKAKKPWWHDNMSHPIDKLAKATEKEKQDYILNGATPSDKLDKVEENGRTAGKRSKRNKRKTNN